MNKKILLIIIISLLLIGVIGFTYSIFSITVEGEGKNNIVKSGTLELVYKDGQSISFPKAMPGESVTKIFTVTNTGTLGIYYDIIYKDLINEIERDELVVSYTCVSYKGYKDSNNKGNIVGECNDLDNKIVPYSENKIDNTLSSDIFIKSTLTHEYTITFTFKEMNKEQNYNQGKEFNTYLNVVESMGIQAKWYEKCTETSNNLNCKIITSQTPSSDENIDFSYTSEGKTYVPVFIEDEYGGYESEEEKTDANQVTNGLYYTSNLALTEDYNEDGLGDRVYYYRGAVTNNNVRFGGFCWRIVRTNEDGSVRLRYNGIYENGTCPTTGTNVRINSRNYAFYGSDNNEKYNEYIWEDGTGESLAKTTIDAWYTSSGLINYEDKIANVPYCADKSNPTTDEYDDTQYGAANRLYDMYYGVSKSDVKPTYKCARVEDKHTVSDDTWGGNEKLTHPIGMLTADEVAFAGGKSSSNSTYYLYTGADYWLISPNYWNGYYAHSFYVHSVGLLHNDSVDYTHGLLPAISLKPEVIVNASGTGSYTNPYVVED